jgi:hypothetical protein
MPVIRKLVAHDNTQDSQWLKVDHSSRYIENHSEEWQFLFGPDSSLSNSSQVVKLAAKFNEDTFDNIQIAAYLYDPKTNSIANATSCQFDIYSVSPPNWTETFLSSVSGTQLPNSYYYANPTLASLGSLDFFGGDTLMIQATIVRLGITYRERIYVNHLGIFDNVSRLRGDVEFLEVTKKDE